MFDFGFDFIILLLVDYEMNVFRIDIVKCFMECGNLVVFIVQINYQYCVCVWVVYYVLQYGVGIDVIVVQL